MFYLLYLGEDFQPIPRPAVETFAGAVPVKRGVFPDEDNPEQDHGE